MIRLNVYIVQENMKKKMDKDMTIWEKVSNIIIKEFNSELIYNKKCLKGEKHSTQKKTFNIFIYQ